MSAITDILDAGYDVRCGVDEIQRHYNTGYHGYLYRYTVNGRIALETPILKVLLPYFMSGRTLDDIEVVSPKYRKRRFRPNVWLNQPDVSTWQQPDRYSRDNETVCDILPDYRITARQLITE